METILVPTDFSKSALNAVKYAFAYAEATNAKIILFHAYDEPTGEMEIPFSGGVYYGKKQARENAEKDIKKLVEKLKKLFNTSNLTWVVQPGVASNGILEYSKKNKISTIVMGTNGEHAIIKKLFGSTTSGIISNATCNVMAVPPMSKYKGINKLVIGADLEEGSLIMLKKAVSYAKQFNAEATIVHVQDLEVFNPQTTLEKLINKLKKQVKYENVSFVTLKETDVVEGLSNYIKKKKPDMLCMINHGRKFPETIFEPSWTKKMAEHLKVPIFILHEKKS